MAGPHKPPPKELKTYKVSSRTAGTIPERDDKRTIYGVRSIADLSREVLERIHEENEKK